MPSCGLLRRKASEQQGYSKAAADPCQSDRISFTHWALCHCHFESRTTARIVPSLAESHDATSRRKRFCGSQTRRCRRGPTWSCVATQEQVVERLASGAGVLQVLEAARAITREELLALLG